MLNIGLRGLTYTPLISDELEGLTYQPSTKRLARTAIDLSKEQSGGNTSFWGDDGKVWESGASDDNTMTVQAVDIPIESLAEVTGSTIDANGVLVAGDINDAPFIALGWESYAVRSANDPEGTPATAYEKVWVYKCKVTLVSYTRHTVEATPTVQTATLNITIFKTKFLQANGKPLTDATVVAGSDVPSTVLNDWFKAPYLPQSVRVPVSKTALQAAITAAQALQETEYTPESWALFDTALTNAVAVNADTNATQAAVDQAVANLVAAQNALVAA